MSIPVPHCASIEDYDRFLALWFIGWGMFLWLLGYTSGRATRRKK